LGRQLIGCQMLDAILAGSGVLFFAAAILYGYACERM
jgi:hypothetical protein